MVSARPVDPLAAKVWDALDGVPDPEMPAVSLVGLGMVADIRVGDASVDVRLTPTFVGCPALAVMQAAAVAAVEQALTGVAVTVEWTAAPAWRSDRVREETWPALAARGIAPPRGDPDRPLAAGDRVLCPWCGSADTRVENVFGPTACRSVHYCQHCHNPFEALKPV